MSAFLRAAQLLSADANLSTALSWISKDGGPPRALRGVLAREEAGFGGEIAPRQVAPATTITIAADALPGRPQRGDLIASEALGWKIESVEADTTGASYLLRVRVV